MRTKSLISIVKVFQKVRIGETLINIFNREKEHLKFAKRTFQRRCNSLQELGMIEFEHIGMGQSKGVIRVVKRVDYEKLASYKEEEKKKEV